jgi:hypothetical protein
MCGQFGFYYWRAMVLSIAALPVSDRIRVAARIAGPAVGSHDLGSILSAYNLVPNLRGGRSNFRAIQAYYAVIEKLGRMIPSMAKWSEVEMVTCSRYAAVLVDQHLERNVACAAEMRGM